MARPEGTTSSRAGVGYTAGNTTDDENDNNNNNKKNHDSNNIKREEEEEEREETTKSQQIGYEILELRDELAKAKVAADGHLNKLKYLMADFDNYRKQSERQVAARIESIKAELLLKFLNIRDDYQRAIEGAKAKSEPAVIEGLEGILRNIDSLLSSEGVTPINATGSIFDPNVHDAITFAPAKEGVKENMVTSELRRGYMLHDKVLRPSLVEVARKIVKNSDVVNNGNTEQGQEGIKKEEE